MVWEPFNWEPDLGVCTCIIGRAGASPPGAQFFIYVRTYVRRCNADTVISISLVTVTSHELRMRTIFIHVFRKRIRHLQEIRFVSEVSTEEREERLARHRRHRISRHCARESAEKSTCRISDWFFYYGVKEFRIFCFVFLTTIVPSCMCTNTILFGCVAN